MSKDTFKKRVSWRAARAVLGGYSLLGLVAAVDGGDDEDSAYESNAAVEAVVIDGAEAQRLLTPRELEDVLPASPLHDPKVYKPMALPVVGARFSGTSQPGGLLEFDLKTGLERIVNLRGEPGTAAPTDLTGSGGIGVRVHRGGDGFDEILGFGGLQRVPEPTRGSYPKHCRVDVCFQNSEGQQLCSQGSGTLIDPLHVLTAGHVVYDHDFNSWAVEAIVRPAFNDGETPFGYAQGVVLYTFSAWRRDRDYNHDVGVIRLDRPIGALTGWRVLGVSTTCEGFRNATTWRHNGYPGEPPPLDGMAMYTHTGSFDECQTYKVGFKYPTGVRGMSGTGAVPTGDAVLAVLSHHTQAGIGVVVYDVRIEGLKSFPIRNYMSESLPQFADLIPLNVQGAPQEVTAGNRLTRMDYVVVNYSAVTFDKKVTARVYISADADITTGDTEIQTHSVSLKLAPRQATRVNVAPPPQIPESLLGGPYWLGVVLDLRDVNVSNNDSDGQDAQSMAIISEPPGPLTPGRSAQGERCGSFF